MQQAATLRPPASPTSPTPPPRATPPPHAPSQVFTQAALVLLLAGNVIGDFCLLADMGVRAARQLFPGAAGPGKWLAAAGGRAAAAALALAVVFPLSCLRRMRQVGGGARRGPLHALPQPSPQPTRSCRR